MCDSGRDHKKIPCVREFRPDVGGNSFCVWPLKTVSIEDLFDGADPDEKVLLEYCEMTQDELDALPDFEGW